MLDKYIYKNTDVATANEFWLSKSIIEDGTKEDALLLAMPTVNANILEDIGAKLFKVCTPSAEMYTVVARFLKAYKDVLLRFDNSELMVGITALQALIQKYGLHISLITFIVNQHPTTYETILNDISNDTRDKSFSDEALYCAVTYLYD